MRERKEKEKMVKKFTLFLFNILNFQIDQENNSKLYKYYKIIKPIVLVALLKENFSALGHSVLEVLEEWLEI